MSEPTNKECKEAVDYFFHEGWIHELTGDKLRYTKILLNATAWSVLFEDLIWEEE